MPRATLEHALDWLGTRTDELIVVSLGTNVAAWQDGVESVAGPA